MEHLGRDLEQTRARLAAEQQARRDQEATLGDIREELDARIAALTARTAVLEKSLEGREQRLVAVTKELAAASDKAAKASDERKKTDLLKARAAKAEERIKVLKAELDDARTNADAADEVDALRAEREDLARRLREAEKKTADASGTAARATTTAEALKRKLDERQNAHRAEADALQERLDTLAGENRRPKEQLAGLNARVRTLTDFG